MIAAYKMTTTLSSTVPLAELRRTGRVRLHRLYTRAQRVALGCLRLQILRTLAVCAPIVSATLGCLDVGPPDLPREAEFVAADHDGRDGLGPTLALMNIGGDQYRKIGGPAGGPVWLPDGQRVAFWRIDEQQYLSRVWITDLISPEHLLVPEGGPLVQEKTPQASLDGQWLYVMGCDVDPPCDFALWRVKVTGADAGQVAERIPVVPPAGNTAIVLSLHDVGSDGRLLVRYVAESLATGETRVLLAALDPTTGVITDLPVSGAAARWSPDMTQIAYVSSMYLYVVPANGGQSRPQPISDYDDGGGFAWSPDGRFLLVRVIGGLHLIDLQHPTVTHLSFSGPPIATPLSSSGALYEPAWRPPTAR